MARKGILSSDAAQPPSPARPKPAAPRRGAVGALQSSLNKLQENAVQEIDAALIDDAGFEDRLGFDSAAQRKLQESLSTYGQQVPVLLRPHGKKPGRFEIVYGRRRLAALKALNKPVKAMVRQLDDHALVMAQGQENTSRQDLSFVEKASFSAQLKRAGYERQTIADALSIDLPMLSRMLKVGEAFTLDFLRQVGSAPGIGRDRWLALAKLFEDPAAKSRATRLMNSPDFPALTSDERFDAVFARAAANTGQKPPKPTASKPRSLRDAEGKVLADIRSGPKGVTLNVNARTANGFDAWLNDTAETWILDLHDRWKKERPEADKT